MDIATRKIAVASGMSFTGVELPHTNTDPAPFHVGGPFIIYIHALAMLPPYLQLARELAMLCVTDDVAEARRKTSHLKAVFSTEQLKSGREIATLMVAAQDNPSFQVEDAFVEAALRRFVTTQPSATSMARQYLLGAAAVLDPTSSLLLELTHPNAHSLVAMNIGDVQLDVQLSKETRVIEVDAVTGAVFRPNDIRVGDSLYRAVSCTAKGNIDHFESGIPQRVTANATSVELHLTQLGTTSFFRVDYACRLFLVRN